MTKKFVKFTLLPIAIAIISFGFKSKESVNLQFVSIEDESLQYHVPTEFESDANPAYEGTFPLAGRSYIGYKEALAQMESGKRYDITNRYGYMGKYQFGAGTLAVLGIDDTKQFMVTPQLQEIAMDQQISRNKWLLRDYINQFAGKTVAGVRITEAGIIAAAHLGGAGNVRDFFDSEGSDIFRDGNNTPVTKYMTMFAEFDTSLVQPRRVPWEA